MSELHTTIELAATAEEVWSVISDLQAMEEWMTIHTSFKGEIPAIGKVKVGTKISEVVTLLGMANTVEWTVDELTDVDDLLATNAGGLKLSGTGMAGVEAWIKMNISPAGEGKTVVTIDAEFTGQMLVGAIGKAVDKAVQQELETSLAKLDELLAAQNA